jgi:hypothetical protein
MNKLFTAIIALSTSFSMAQVTIPNNDFENWTDSTKPVSWETQNGLSDAFKIPYFTTKSSDAFHGNSAVKIKNVKSRKYNSPTTFVDTIYGGWIKSDVSIQNKAVPAYMKGKIKLNLTPNEKAVIDFGYKVKGTGNNSTIYLLGKKVFTGVSNGYESFQINTNNFFYPAKKSDTLQIFISTYNIYSKNAVAVSDQSSILVDSVAFVGSLPSPTLNLSTFLENPDFNIWDDNSGFKSPRSWFLTSTVIDESSSQVNQSIDSKSGSYALEFQIVPEGNPTVGYTLFKAGDQNKFLNGFSKFNLGEKDSVKVFLSKYTSKDGLGDDFIDSIYFTGSQNTYKSFSLQFGNKVSPTDTLALVIFAFNPIQFENFRLENVSSFLIDDLSLSTIPLAIDDKDASKETLFVSPNPSNSGVFNIQSFQKLDNLKLYNSTGLEIKIQANYAEKSDTIDLSTNARGIYYLVQEGQNKRTKLIY